VRQSHSAWTTLSERDDPAATYVFKHALVRDAAYESLQAPPPGAARADCGGFLQAAEMAKRFEKPDGARSVLIVFRHASNQSMECDINSTKLVATPHHLTVAR
jgi:hypothetical protein